MVHVRTLIIVDSIVHKWECTFSALWCIASACSWSILFLSQIIFANTTCRIRARALGINTVLRRLLLRWNPSGGARGTCLTESDVELVRRGGLCRGFVPSFDGALGE